MAKSIGELREGLTFFTDLEGAWGKNMHESKDVLLKIGDTYHHLESVGVTFHNGSFVMVLTAGDEDA